MEIIVHVKKTTCDLRFTEFRTDFRQFLVSYQVLLR